MCGIFAVSNMAGAVLSQVCRANAIRGQDGFGVVTHTRDGADMLKTPGRPYHFAAYRADGYVLRALGCCRAEPTTEIVPSPTDDDQQPYQVGGWSVVHNGVIANDRELLAENDLVSPTRIDSWVIAGLLDKLTTEHAELGITAIFREVIGMLKGSFAIIAEYAGVMFYACNYRPLYRSHVFDEYGVLSSVQMPGIADDLVTPYSWGVIISGGLEELGELRPHRNGDRKTLVVLSGGLDSTTVAAMCIAMEHEVAFLHFDYGCRATSNERLAVEAIAAHYKRPLHVLDMRAIFQQIGHSRLLDPTVNAINNGEAGAEQAIEWVPARNTILASVAMGFAEGNGFDAIALGINLEESGGGYTDNVIDLYQGFNKLMQWIIGVDKRLEFISPVGSMMKHEIVAAGLEVDAPYHLTWSCYNQGSVHCGECGPCVMRRRAFIRNGKIDPVPYACDDAGAVAALAG